MNRSKEVAASAAVTVAGVLLAFSPAVLGLRTLSQRDTDLLYAPVRTLVVQELQAGRLPLWNPYEGTGKPLFAEGIHSVLHPISLLGAAIAPSSIDFLILAYLVAASVGAFLLARTLGASPPASAGAGLAYAFSGYSASMTGNLVFLAGLSTLPWLLAAARSAGAGARWGTAATALATACAFLSGDAQIALVGLLLGLLLAADAGGRRGALRAVAGTLTGLLLAAVQIAATAAQLANTYRAVDLSEVERTRWALHPGRLLEWLVPGLFRGPLDQVAVDQSGAWLEEVFAESVYLGVPLLAAATLGARMLAATGRRRTGLLLCGSCVVLLWLALGHRLGARQLLDWVPVWSRFRYTEKLMAPLTLCLCALGALGIDSFGPARLPKPWRRALSATALAAAALLLAFLLAPDATRELSIQLLGAPATFYHSTLVGGLPHPTLAIAALLSLDGLRPERIRIFGLAFLLAIAPAAAVYHGAHLGRRDLRGFTSHLRFHGDDPVVRLLHPDDRIQATDDPRGPIDARIAVDSIVLGPAVNVPQRIDTIGTYGAFEPGRLTSLARPFGERWVTAFRRYAATHVVLQTLVAENGLPSLGPLAVEGGRLVQRDQPLGFELWAVSHRAWAFFPQRALPAHSPQEALGLLLDLVARADDDAVVVEAPEAPSTALGRVLRVDRRVGTVRIEAESVGPSLLVVQDAFWPGWRASVDGQPAEILATDVLVRAVRWPAGRHRLEMTYDPPEVRLGLALSALGALLTLALAAMAMGRGRALWDDSRVR